VSGTAIKDHLRTVSNPPGAVVYSFADGAKLLGEGKKINYEGASGSCDFDQIGDICRHRSPSSRCGRASPSS